MASSMSPKKHKVRSASPSGSSNTRNIGKSLGNFQSICQRLANLNQDLYNGFVDGKQLAVTRNSSPLSSDSSPLITPPATPSPPTSLDLGATSPNVLPGITAPLSGNIFMLRVKSPENLWSTPQSTLPVPHHSTGYNELARKYRADLAVHIIGLYNKLNLHDNINTCWDNRGNYTVDIQQYPGLLSVGISYHTGRVTIEPLYRVDIMTQLLFVKARLFKLSLDNDLTYDLSTTKVKDGQPHTEKPVHVFVDISNITISFYDHMKSARNLPKDTRIHGDQAQFFFQALAVILERGRPVAKRVVVGSLGPGQASEQYMTDAETLGYTAHILKRVKGVKPSKMTSSTPAKAASPAPANSHHEQAVDEILQLHMLESIIDTPAAPTSGSSTEERPTMVLASGDGAPTDFSAGFFAQVMRALRNGWNVEVVGFSRNMNRIWNERQIPEQWRSRFRKIALDPFAEELLMSFR